MVFSTFKFPFTLPYLCVEIFTLTFIYPNISKTGVEV